MLVFGTYYNILIYLWEAAWYRYLVVFRVFQNGNNSYMC